MSISSISSGASSTQALQALIAQEQRAIATAKSAQTKAQDQAKLTTLEAQLEADEGSSQQASSTASAGGTAATARALVDVMA